MPPYKNPEIASVQVKINKSNNITCTYTTLAKYKLFLFPVSLQNKMEKEGRTGRKIDFILEKTFIFIDYKGKCSRLKCLTKNV